MRTFVFSRSFVSSRLVTKIRKLLHDSSQFGKHRLPAPCRDSQGSWRIRSSAHTITLERTNPNFSKQACRLRSHPAEPPTHTGSPTIHPVAAGCATAAPEIILPPDLPYPPSLRVRLRLEFPFAGPSVAPYPTRATRPERRPAMTARKLGIGMSVVQRVAKERAGAVRGPGQ